MNKEYKKQCQNLINNHLKAKDLVGDIDYRIVLSDELKRMGSFAACIGEALVLADQTNLNLLCASFAGLIVQANTNLGNRDA